jgi:hypothetical protein
MFGVNVYRLLLNIMLYNEVEIKNNITGKNIIEEIMNFIFSQS